MKSSVVIYNPAARESSPEKIRRAELYLAGKGFDTEILRTEAGGDAVRLAREALRRDPELVIAAGGDGTVNEVANGIVGSGVPLAILPLGTTNVLARELKIPRGLESALEAAVCGRTVTIFPGRIEWGDGASRLFCLMVGVGFDAETVRDVNAGIKALAGKAAYIISGMRNLAAYSPRPILFRIDGREYRGAAAVIGKAARYGGDFRITPDANLSEASFYTCIFQSAKRVGFLLSVLGVLRGGQLRRKDVVYLRSSEIEICGGAHLQIDGDYIGMGPAKISVGNDLLKVVAAN